MSNGGSLINLGGLAEPANKLIDKISEAVGGLCKPWQIKRVAKAEGEAEIIRAEAHLEISDRERRALTRFVREEDRKQANMEAIAAKALPNVKADAKPDEIETDWIAHFFDKCRLVSNEEMQVLWSKILAGEANSPGSFSKRAIDAVSMLAREDAAIFATLCRYSWQIAQIAYPLVLDVVNPIYNVNAIQYGTLQHLANIGLISFDDIGGYRIGHLPKVVRTSYYGREVDLTLRHDKDNFVPIGCVALSVTGVELSQLCEALPVEGFFEFICDRWRKDGLIPDPSATG